MKIDKKLATSLGDPHLPLDHLYARHGLPLR